MDNRVKVGKELQTSGSILNTAKELVDGDRAKTHGPKRRNHDNIATLWNAYLWGIGFQEGGMPVLRAQDVAMMMSLVKVARTFTGSHNLDDYIDGAAYLAIAGELADGEETPF